jgi:orotidine-5'-phosphate decarboxylase
MTGFHEQLAGSWSTGSMLCVGLDPDPTRYPRAFDAAPDAALRFCTAIVDATADLVCAFKPQIAYFAAQSAEHQLERLCHYIREKYPHVTLILDAKRGDIASTAEQYAHEAFGRYAAHAVTVNPYLGTDSVRPFLARGGVLGLCRNSNPGAAELQGLYVDGTPVYLKVADMIAQRWAKHGQCGLVVGATAPKELALVRERVADLPILVPGVGAQGGDVGEAVRHGRTSSGTGLIISSSRAILYATSDDDFADAARAVAQATRDEIAAAQAA